MQERERWRNKQIHKDHFNVNLMNNSRIYLWDYEVHLKESGSRKMCRVAVSKQLTCKSHTSINNSARFAWHASSTSLLPPPTKHTHPYREREGSVEWINSSMKHEKGSLCHYVAHPQLHSSSEAQHCGSSDLPRALFPLLSSPLPFCAVNVLTFPTKRVFFTHSGWQPWTQGLWSYHWWQHR